VLGVVGVVAAFGLFYLADRVFHLDRAHIQTLMYLKLSVAGHLTIFLTRTRGPFWTIRPARILLIAVFGTQVIATLIAVYGLFMTPLGWGWALFVWGYALAWFLVNDRIKLLTYWFLDRSKGAPKIRAKAVGKADADPTSQPSNIDGEVGSEISALSDMRLGDVLLAGVLKHPEEAGQIVTQAVAAAGAHAATVSASRAAAEPQPKPKALQHPKAIAKPARRAKTRAASTRKAAT